MKKYLYFSATAFLVVLLVLAGIVKVKEKEIGALQVLTIPQGGTGTSTRPSYGQLLVGNSQSGYDLVATSSLGISGGGSSFGQVWEIITNVFGQSAVAPTTTQNIHVSGTGTSTFSGGLDVSRQITAPYFHATSTSATSTFEHGLFASGLRAASWADFDFLTSALVITGSGGDLAEYAGTSCTNQFVRALSALGVATCATVTSSDIDSSIVPSARTLTVSGTSNQITSSAGAQDLSANRTWTLSLPSHVIFPSSFQATNATVTNATTSDFTVQDQTWLSTITSALVLTGSDGLIAEYAGTSCTNQFVRSLSVLGAATCATVGAADVSLANLTATDGTLTFSGTYNGSTARTIGLNLANANTWTALQTTTYASTTHLAVLTNLWIPASANPTISNLGHLGIDTTAASTSLRYADADGSERAIYDIKSKSLLVASSTLTYNGAFGAAGTTTLLLWNPLHPVTVVSASCKSDTGTAKINFNDGSNLSTMVNCSTAGTLTTISTNNTFVMLEDFKVDIGTSASTPNRFTITVNYRETAE